MLVEPLVSTVSVDDVSQRTRQLCHLLSLKEVLVADLALPVGVASGAVPEDTAAVAEHAEFLLVLTATHGVVLPLFVHEELVADQVREHEIEQADYE